MKRLGIIKDNFIMKFVDFIFTEGDTEAQKNLTSLEEKHYY